MPPPEVRCSKCGWRGHPFDAVPVADPDPYYVCPDCGERVEQDEPPDQPATEPS